MVIFFLRIIHKTERLTSKRLFLYLMNKNLSETTYLKSESITIKINEVKIDCLKTFDVSMNKIALLYKHSIFAYS